MFKLLPLCLFCLLSVPTLAVASSGVSHYPIAGVTPWQRPEGAPTILWLQHDKAWYQEALTGIRPFYPYSLYFLDNQGNWYTPFTRPGMLPPYDIRGWHKHQ